MISYIKETKYKTKEEALMAAYCDIENDLAEPMEIVDANGDLIYNSETIYETFVQSDHKPITTQVVIIQGDNKKATYTYIIDGKRYNSRHTDEYRALQAALSDIEQHRACPVSIEKRAQRRAQRLGILQRIKRALRSNPTNWQ